ncbi:MAG TPA: chromate efflux transporter [Asticcacaulis sp.]|nr:chromate efflux transporter [Asticcacaulis sp.]
MGSPASGGEAAEVFLAFLKLGLTAFGGPVAHLGYFREEFVNRRRWLDEAAYADLVALCQFLPGPASSQVGFALGLRRAGLSGALAAWLGFTLPSAALMIAFAYGVGFMTGGWAQGVIHGLKLVAVAVVAQAVWGMARTLTPDLRRLVIAALACAMIFLAAGAFGQIGALLFGAVAGLAVCRTGQDEARPDPHPVTASRRIGVVAAILFPGLLIGAPVLGHMTDNAAVARFSAFYRSGALVFGGGHVVLPLLKQAVVDPGWIGPDVFLAGYGFAQAVPGPLFSFAAFLGAAMPGAPNGMWGGLIGLAGIFLPGMLALLAALPFWSELQNFRSARAIMRGANAAVVGILAAALYNPVGTSAIRHPIDLGLAAAGFVLLTRFRTPPVMVVILGATAGLALAVLRI